MAFVHRQAAFSGFAEGSVKLFLFLSSEWSYVQLLPSSTKSPSGGLSFVLKWIFFFQLGVLHMVFKYVSLHNEYFKFKTSKTDLVGAFLSRELASGPRT